MEGEMSSSAWVLMDDDCDCGGPPPGFHLPPPPVPPDIPCELMDMTCPSLLNPSDAEFKRIGSFPSVTVIVCCTLLSAVILLVIGVIVWRKKRKGVTQTKDFDHHNGPSMMNMNGNGILYEDLSHARPRPPIAPPALEMLDVNHHALIGNNGTMMGNSKLDFSYFLNPPPIYEELPDHLSERNNGPSDDEFAEDELSVIDVPLSQNGVGPGVGENLARIQQQRGNGTDRNGKLRTSSQSLTRKRPGRSSGGGTGNPFKSQRSLDRRSGRNGGNKYPGTNPRLPPPAYQPRQQQQRLTVGMDNNNPGSMIIMGNNGMTMKIPPHLVAVFAESALCNGVNTRPYDVIQTGGVNGGIYPSSRSSGSSYGDGSSGSSGRPNPGGNSIESSSFDSGIGPHSITSFMNTSPYDQAVLAPAYPYEYGGGNPAQFNMAQHPSFRRLRVPADRDHPLYSNHLLT